jgi:hypothetical protein
VVHRGSTYQARSDTAREPPHEDWALIASAGRNAISPTVRGTFSEVEKYSFLDIVALNGSSFIARADNPGPCPGDGWQLIASAGKPGKPGPKGDQGQTGARGSVGLSIKGFSVDRKGYSVTLVMSDGSELEPIQLRSLFEQYNEES